MSPENELEGFLARYDPPTATRAREALDHRRGRTGGAFELVYDNYNALAIGFAPAERTSEAVLSIALYPRWVSLFFLKGATLADPEDVLSGTDSVARHIVLRNRDTIEQPAVSKLIDLALAGSGIEATREPNRLIIKSVSAKQRQRRPA